MCSEHLYWSTVGHNHLIQRLFDIAVLNILCNLFNAIQTWKAEWLCGYRMIVNVPVVRLLILMIAWLTGSCSSLPLPHITKRVWHHLSLAWQKDQNSKMKYSFYWIRMTFAALQHQQIILDPSYIWNHRSCPPSHSHISLEGVFRVFWSLCWTPDPIISSIRL